MVGFKYGLWLIDKCLVRFFLGEFFFAITFFFLLPTVLDCHGIRQQCVAVCNVILECWKVKSLVDCNQKLIIIKLLNELNIVRWNVWKIGGANSNRRAESAPPPHWNSVSAKYLGWKSASLHLQFRRSWNPFEYYSRLWSEICVYHHKELKAYAFCSPFSIGYVKKGSSIDSCQYLHNPNDPIQKTRYCYPQM